MLLIHYCPIQYLVYYCHAISVAFPLLCNSIYVGYLSLLSHSISVAGPFLSHIIYITGPIWSLLSLILSCLSQTNTFEISMVITKDKKKQISGILYGVRISKQDSRFRKPSSIPSKHKTFV